MTNTRITIALLSILALPACLDGTEAPDFDELHADGEELAIGGDHVDGEPAGSMWGPCVFKSAYGGAEADGWGCDGGIEGGLACAKPGSSSGYLSICVPLNEGGCAAAPFGLGFDEERAYCVPLCGDVSHCDDGMECSGNGMCAWGEP